MQNTPTWINDPLVKCSGYRVPLSSTEPSLQPLMASLPLDCRMESSSFNMGDRHSPVVGATSTVGLT